MSLRAKVSKLFAPQTSTSLPERPRDAWKSARIGREERQAAKIEREKQLQEFEQRKAATHNEDLNEQRRLAALQHAKLNLIPPGATELQAKALIERRATEALDRKNQLERGEIEQKPVHRLVVDARAREAREASNRLPPRDKEGDRAAEHQQAPVDQQSLTEMRAREPALEPEPVTEAYIKQVMDAQASEQAAELEPMEMNGAGPPAEAEAKRGPMTSEERAARIEAAAAQALEADHDHDPGREM